MAWTPVTRADHDRSRLRCTRDMTDEEFARFSPLLPGQPRRGRKRRTDLRRVIDAIFYVLQSACAWANLPKRWIVERTLAWISANRRMARDFERYAETAKVFICIAMIKLMARRLARFVNS